jgi:2-polyprenyl-3-methyl-5-hydroxy-6-metoxy-1,4-benzoquinol methylase
MIHKISPRHCTMCGTGGNPIVASEKPCARWNNKPWMPEDHYTLIRCKRCGNLYVDSDVTEEYLDNLQAEVVPEFSEKTIYERNQEAELVRYRELEMNWNMITNIRKPLRGERLLDFGSAWGAFGNIAQRDGIIPNGIELQPSAVRSSLKLWGEGIVHCGPIKNAPFKKGEFQYVTCFETLEHLFNPIGVLRELKQLLSKDGILSISVPSADYFIFKYWFYRKQPAGALMRKILPGNMQEGRVLAHNHINTFSIQSATLMIESSGLRPIHISPIGWRAGRIGRICKKIGSLSCLTSRHIAFAPSIFIIADNG